MIYKPAYMAIPLGLLSACGWVRADVVINEVLGSTTGDDTEYVELYNAGDAPEAIGGWTIELWDSDRGDGFGEADGASPFSVPAGTALEAGQYFLFANLAAADAFGVTPDVVLDAGATIENSSYTIALRDGAGDVVNTVFVTDGGPEDTANLAGEMITADLAIGPEGEFLPAGFSRVPDGADTLVALEFSPVPAPSGTPTAGLSGTAAPDGTGDPVSIMAIQGAAQTSPLLGNRVVTAGVVTAVAGNGFYVQDLAGDGDINTSDALFVFTGDAPTVSVGDTIAVSGNVGEFTPGGTQSGNLSTTQVSSTRVTVTGSAELPAPVVLGAAGRAAPTQNIDDDAFVSFDPDSDGIDYFESLEAMRVTVPSPLAIAPTSGFGEIFTVADTGGVATGLSERQTLNISPADFNPEKIQIDADADVLPGFEIPSVNAGAFLSDVTGVVGYGFGNFEVVPTEPFTVTDSSLQPEVSTIAMGDGRLSVASYNVLNLDTNDADGDEDVANGRFETIASQIVDNLQTPDIIALQEIQDNDGSEDSGTVAADVTLQAITDAITGAGGPAYEFIDTEGLIDGSVGGQPGGNIRVGFLYNPARVELQGEATPLTEPSDQASNEQNPFFGSRISLATDFGFGDATVTIVNNHLSSKGGSAPIFGTEQPFDQRQEDVTVNGSLDERRLQAQAVAEFVEGKLADDERANIIVLGDMNEFEFVSPVADILGGQLSNTTDALAENERYSFIFQGNSQQLDHALVSDNLASDFEFDIVHVNAEFADTDERASDHEPLLLSVVPGGGRPFTASDQPRH